MLENGILQDLVSLGTHCVNRFSRADC